MRPIFPAILSLLLVAPTLGTTQEPATGPVRAAAFESLHQSQWVRLSSPESGRHQGRLLHRNAGELILSHRVEPVRIPATTIDTLWTRGNSTRTGAIVGALLGLGLGAVAAGSLGEGDIDRNALWAVSLGGGTVGGGLIGMLIGTVVPRWNRRFP